MKAKTITILIHYIKLCNRLLATTVTVVTPQCIFLSLFLSLSLSLSVCVCVWNELTKGLQ